MRTKLVTEIISTKIPILFSGFNHTCIVFMEENYKNQEIFKKINIKKFQKVSYIKFH